MYSKTMLRSNASEMIVKSSVVPETKTEKQRKQKKQPATAVVVVSRTAEKKTSRVTACAPTPKIDRKRLEENLTPEITFRQPGRFLVGLLVAVQRPLFLGFT